MVCKKIKFDGFYNPDGKLNREAQIILDILEKHYEVEISDTPDYIFSRAGSKEYYKYDGVRIFCTIEALCPDFNLCDYGIGFEYLTYQDRYLRLPNFYFYEDAVEKMLHKHEDVNEKDANREFCSFVYSNNRADKMRGKIFDALMGYKKVDSGGRYMNNLPDKKAVDDKLEFEGHHKFSVACENACHPGYHTEKLVEAFAAKTVPIYWGDPEVEKVFNEKAFINCNQFSSVEEIVERVQYLDTHEAEYLAMLKEPAMKEEGKLDGLKALEDYLLHIFDQPLEKAYRRNRGFWGKQYLNTVRSEGRVVEKYLKLRQSFPMRLVRKIFRK